MSHDGSDTPSAVVRPGRDDRTQDLMQLLAAWALVHEGADEAWRAAVARGEGGHVEGHVGGDAGAGAFADVLAALVAAEKERLKARLTDPAAGAAAGAAGATGGEPDAGDVARRLDAIAFELAELRGRLESLQASVDALLACGAPSDPGADRGT